MAKDRQVPAWLARRAYFRRIGRWTKPDKGSGAAAVPEAAPSQTSNVVPFPIRIDRPDRPNFGDRRNVGIA